MVHSNFNREFDNDEPYYGRQGWFSGWGWKDGKWGKKDPTEGLDPQLVGMYNKLKDMKDTIEAMMDALEIKASKKITGKDKKNSIHMITPWRDNGVWKFDDETVGLYSEPFVGAVNRHLTILGQHIPDAHLGMNILFSEIPFPGHTMTFTWLRTDGGGNTYSCTAEEGAESWFCPALYKYFPEAPKVFYAQAVALERDEVAEPVEEPVEEPVDEPTDTPLEDVTDPLALLDFELVDPPKKGKGKGKTA